MSSIISKEASGVSIDSKVISVKVENNVSKATFDGNNWFNISKGDEETNIFVLLNIAFLQQQEVHAELTHNEISTAFIKS